MKNESQIEALKQELKNNQSARSYLRWSINQMKRERENKTLPVFGIVCLRQIVSADAHLIKRHWEILDELRALGFWWSA